MSLPGQRAKASLMLEPFVHGKGTDGQVCGQSRLSWQKDWIQRKGIEFSIRLVREHDTRNLQQVEAVQSSE